jgi:hypothetical protein
VTARAAIPVPEAPLHWLVPHPAKPAPAGYSVRAAAVWSGPRHLRLRYDVRGPAGTLHWPAASRLPESRDGLWQHTCCELFLQAGDGGYVEVNLAPEGHWAAYSFSGYRTRAAQELAWQAPRIEASAAPGDGNDAGGDGHWLLQATLELPIAPAAHAPLGLCVVLESAHDGTLSYWALAHPRAQPDFHDAAGHLPTKDIGSSA